MSTHAARRLPALDRRRSNERAALTRLAAAHEAALAAHVLQSLRNAGQTAARSGGRKPATLARTAASAFASGLTRVLRPSLRQTARAFGDRLRSHPKAAHALETKAYDDYDAAIAAWLDQHAAQAVVRVSDSLRETIREVVEQAVAEGLGEEEIAKRIEEATSGEIGRQRARVIARTETHFASQVGQYVAAWQSVLKFDKIWLATEDHRARKGHAEMNDVRVAFDQPFRVRVHGGKRDGEYDELRFPGDPDAPAGQVINCRCQCLYEPSENQDYAADDFPMQAPAVNVVTPPSYGPAVPRPAPATSDDLPTPEPTRRTELVVWATAIDLDLGLGEDTPDTDEEFQALPGRTLTIGRLATWYEQPTNARIAGIVGAQTPGALDEVRRRLQLGRRDARNRAGVWRITVLGGALSRDQLPAPLYVRSVELVTWGSLAAKRTAPSDGTKVWLVDAVIDPKGELPE